VDSPARRGYRRRMMRRLYDWTIALARSPRAPYALGGVSFAESSFFPIPPDVMLVPMALARPERAWSYAAICTVTSVLGGLLGYAIGSLFYDTAGKWLLDLYGLTGKADEFRALYQQYGHWVILIKGMTPIPYKLVTIVSGFAAYDLVWFTVLSIITRGARFFLVAGILNRFGDAIRLFIDANLGLVLGALAVFIVGGFLSVRFLF
jgi:membrane protein YqaA with SNARE-associated domain